MMKQTKTSRPALDVQAMVGAARICYTCGGAIFDRRDRAQHAGHAFRPLSAHEMDATMDPLGAYAAECRAERGEAS